MGLAESYRSQSGGAGHATSTQRSIMAEGDDKQQPPTTEASNTKSDLNVQTISTPEPPPNRAELVDKARAFLGSPQVIHEDTSAKRRFLAEKGLNDSEIETLILEQVGGG